MNEDWKARYEVVAKVQQVPLPTGLQPCDKGFNPGLLGLMTKTLGEGEAWGGPNTS